MEPLLTEQSNATCCRKWGNFHNLAENANLSYYLWAWQNKSWQFSPAGMKRCCTRRLGEGCALCRAKVVWMVVPMSWDHSLQDCSISTTKPCCNSMQWFFVCVCFYRLPWTSWPHDSGGQEREQQRGSTWQLRVSLQKPLLLPREPWASLTNMFLFRHTTVKPFCL